MFSNSEVQKAEDLIKKELKEKGQCFLSVDEVIWLYKKTGTWDTSKWVGINVPDGVGAV